MCRSEEKSSSVFFAFYIPPDTIDANSTLIVVTIATMAEKADDGNDVMTMEVETRWSWRQGGVSWRCDDGMVLFFMTK